MTAWLRWQSSLPLNLKVRQKGRLHLSVLDQLSALPWPSHLLRAPPGCHPRIVLQLSSSWPLGLCRPARLPPLGMLWLHLSQLGPLRLAWPRLPQGSVVFPPPYGAGPLVRGQLSLHIGAYHLGYRCSPPLGFHACFSGPARPLEPNRIVRLRCGTRCGIPSCRAWSIDHTRRFHTPLP